MKSHNAYGPTGSPIGSFTAAEIYERWSDECWADRCERDATDWSEVWIESGNCLLPPYEFLAVHEADFFRGTLDAFLPEFCPNTRLILATLYSTDSLRKGPFRVILRCRTGQRTPLGGYIPFDMEEEIDVYPIPFHERQIQGIEPLDGESVAIHCLRSCSLLVGELIIDDHDDDDELTCYTFSGDCFYYPTGIHVRSMLRARDSATIAAASDGTRWGHRPTPDILAAYSTSRPHSGSGVDRHWSTCGAIHAETQVADGKPPEATKPPH